MRFETSQTTPSFRDRRLQLRMLSFVGLISIIMVTLTVINHRPTTVPDDALRQAIDSPTDETMREQRVLKPDEVIMLAADENDGPRGQWADTTNEATRDDVTLQDRELFKPRKQERSEEGKLFSRRTAQPVQRDDSRARRDSALEDDLPDDSRMANRIDPDQPPDSPPLNGKQGGVSNLRFRKRIEDPTQLPTRRDPLSSEGSTQQGNDLDQPGDETVEPFREDVPIDSPIGTIGTSDDDIPSGPPLRRRPVNPAPVNEFEPNRDFADADNQPAPFDRRRKKDLWLSDQADVQPFREDLAPVQIDKRYLDLVKDNTMGIRRDESEAFYWLLDHARRVPASTLERSGLREIQYINLMTEPDRFRGEPITIEGDLWRLYEFDAGRNDYGVSRVYEGWVFTGDSANHPYRIVCTSLPKGIEPGENLRKPVRITGYFFKREGYRSNGGVHVAPTLLARRITVNPMPNGIPLTSGIVPYLIVATMAVGLALLVTIVGFAIGDERSTRAGLQRLRRHPHLSLAGLAVPTSVPVEESLRQFAERERQTAISGAYGPLLSRQTAREHGVQEFSPSRQNSIDEGIRQHQKQTTVVQDWATRQKQIQAEIDSLHASKTLPSQGDWPDGGELDSDTFDPARNILTKPKFVAQPVLAPETSGLSTSPVAQPVPLTSQQFARETFFDTTPAFTNPHPVVSQPHLIVTPLPSNISYGASKLSEWEEEVAKMVNRAGTRPVTNQLDANSMERSAAAQIERDRLAREHEIRDRIQRQQLESEHLRLEQLERDRIDREQLERERHQHELRERDRIAHERYSLENGNDDGVTYSLAPSRTAMTPSERLELEQLEHERLERERSEREHAERERLNREREEHARHEHDRQERMRHERERSEREHADRERLQRERDEHARVEHEHARIEHEHQERIRHDRERLERERSEHERLERERIEHDRLHTHREYDRHIDSMDHYSADTDIVHGPHDSTDIVHRSHDPAHLRHDVPETDFPSSDDVVSDSTADDATPRGSSSGWGRSRKRRRNSREGGSN